MKWTKTIIGEVSCIVTEDYKSFDEMKKLIPKNVRVMTCIEAMTLIEKTNVFKEYENISYYILSEKYGQSQCYPVGRGLDGNGFDIIGYNGKGVFRGLLLVKKKKGE